MGPPAPWLLPSLDLPVPVVVGLPVVFGLLVAALGGCFLRRLPEPRSPVGDDAEAVSARAEIAAKIPYARLDRPAVRLLAAVLVAAATAVVTITVAPSAWPAWLVLAAVGVPLAVIDGCTTWIPARWTRIGWLLVLLTTPVGLLAGATTRDLLRTGLGGLAAGAFFWVVWRVSGHVALGDVRLAPLLGAAGAALSWSGLLAVLLSATLAGAVHGLLRWIRRRAGPFPYAPGLVGGAFAAPLLGRLFLG